VSILCVGSFLRVEVVVFVWEWDEEDGKGIQEASRPSRQSWIIISGGWSGYGSEGGGEIMDACERRMEDKYGRRVWWIIRPLFLFYC
jgi:hypothetical protein